MATFDFHKVAESADVEVYQAMTKLKMKETKDEDGNVIPVAQKYSPMTFKNVSGDVVSEALESFKGYDVDSVTLSGNGGLTVRVARNKNNPFVAKEENIDRLEPIGGDK